MGMIKKTSTATAPAPAAAAPVAEAPKAAAPAANDNGTAAAINRLQKKTETVPPTAKTSVSRDYDKEARGKTRCVQFEAALMSPAIAGMKWDNIDEYLALVRKAADAGVAYTFGE